MAITNVWDHCSWCLVVLTDEKDGNFEFLACKEHHFSRHDPETTVNSAWAIHDDSDFVHLDIIHSLIPNE